MRSVPTGDEHHRLGNPSFGKIFEGIGFAQREIRGDVNAVESSQSAAHLIDLSDLVTEGEMVLVIGQSFHGEPRIIEGLTDHGIGRQRDRRDCPGSGKLIRAFAPSLRIYQLSGLVVACSYLHGFDDKIADHCYMFVKPVLKC